MKSSLNATPLALKMAQLLDKLAFLLYNILKSSDDCLQLERHASRFIRSLIAHLLFRRPGHARRRVQLKPEQEKPMEMETKYFVLVSEQIPFDMMALDASGEHGLAEGPSNKLVSEWDYRVYEVPEFGSFEGVEVTEDDRFIVQAQGYSLEALDSWPHEVGMIGDIRPLGGSFLVVTPIGDYIDVEEDPERFLRTYAPQRFDLVPFPTWDPNSELGDDLTEDVVGEP